MLNLFIVNKSLVGFCMYEWPKLDIITKEPMLDWSTYEATSWAPSW